MGLEPCYYLKRKGVAPFECILESRRLQIQRGAEYF